MNELKSRPRADCGVVLLPLLFLPASAANAIPAGPSGPSSLPLAVRPCRSRGEPALPSPGVSRTCFARSNTGMRAEPRAPAARICASPRWSCPGSATVAIVPSSLVARLSGTSIGSGFFITKFAYTLFCLLRDDDCWSSGPSSSPPLLLLPKGAGSTSFEVVASIASELRLGGDVRSHGRCVARLLEALTADALGSLKPFDNCRAEASSIEAGIVSDVKVLVRPPMRRFVAVGGCVAHDSSRTDCVDACVCRRVGDGSANGDVIRSGGGICISFDGSFTD